MIETGIARNKIALKDVLNDALKDQVRDVLGLVAKELPGLPEALRESDSLLGKTGILSPDGGIWFSKLFTHGKLFDDILQHIILPDPERVNEVGTEYAVSEALWVQRLRMTSQGIDISIITNPTTEQMRTMRKLAKSTRTFMWDLFPQVTEDNEKFFGMKPTGNEFIRQAYRRTRFVINCVNNNSNRKQLAMLEEALRAEKIDQVKI